MYAVFKRTFDIIFSAVMLVLLSPVMLATAILVKIKLGGPVIFVNYRPGKNGKVFALYKFRSMTNARDAEGNLLPDDMRHTKFGKLLRSTSLDELPQLWNILKGDMSLIGPRPMIVRDAMYYGIQGNKVHELAVRPGITGRAQVNGRNDTTWEQVFESNKYYYEHFGFVEDMKVFFKTFAVVLSRKSIEKRKYAYYNEYLLDKGIIDEQEFVRGIKYQHEVEHNCDLGITQYVTPCGEIPTKQKAEHEQFAYAEQKTSAQTN